VSHCDNFNQVSTRPTYLFLTYNVFIADAALRQAVTSTYELEIL